MTTFDKLNIAQKRYVLAQASKQTPGIYYYDRHIVGPVPEKNEKFLRMALFAVAVQSLLDLPEDKTLEDKISGITHRDEPRGDWEMEVEWAHALEPVLEPVEDVELPTENLREWISENANSTPYTLYLSDVKLHAVDESKGSAMAQHLQRVCSAAFEANIKEFDFAVNVIQTLPEDKSGLLRVRGRHVSEE